MFPVRYVHAADLHLDAAFHGISREASGEDMAARLRAAAFTALDRLIALCEKEKPDFLIIAGDIYNQEDRSLKAQMALRDGCERLAACGVRTFLAHGNHDPLPSRLQALRWPSNTVVFGEDVESHIVTREGAPVAVVHGVSHATARESRNLARAFSRLDMSPHTDDEDARRCFQIGVLHCALEGMHAERYAPCSLDDLKAAGLDAWALGHVHERRIVCEAPFAAYPGNIQGLHINEPGPRGCLLVTAMAEASSGREGGSGFSCAAVFHSLAPVQWESLEVDVTDVAHLDKVETALQEALEKAGAAADVACGTLMARARLTGRTELDGLLRAPAAAAELAERLRDAATGRPLAWLKDIVVDTGRHLDMDNLLQREDLLGETLRIFRDQRENPDDQRAPLREALAPLFRHPKARRALAPLDAAALDALLDEAQRLCIDLMEVR